ncbi:MAG: GMC family oxidoreductase [Flammeovirgaceae bacterium]|nr:GMC family oxidoreductase [Flammeovirgaceae bacterium]
MNTKYDIIIIGSGAGGGTLAYKLAPSGKKILIIERGDFIPKEKENWDPHQVFTVGRYRTTEKWYDKDDQPFSPYTHYAVGGNTKMYGGALFRLRESDFKETKHFGGVSPAWPISYEELEPFYTEAEKLYSVHGERGVDPTEPKATSGYPFPPLKHEPSMQELYDNIQSLGYKPFPLPIGVRLGENGRGGSSPVHLSNFDGFPDPTEAKADAQVVSLKEALKAPNVHLLTHVHVDKLITDKSGKRIAVVEATRDGKKISFEGDVVVLAAGAVNSAAILLRSGSGLGLANSSGMVGRNYMLHQNGCVINFSSKPNTSQFQKSFSLSDFYHGADDAEFPLGAIQLMGKNDPDTVLDLAKDHFPGKSFEELSTHSIDFWITSEDLPDPNNQVTLRKDGSIKTIYTVNNREAYTRLKKKLFDILDKLAAKDPLYKNSLRLGYDLGVSGVSHQMGTLKFGHDQKSSVLDVNCKAHDLDNLYAVDASFFVSSGAFNPSLTIMANALRVGKHLLDRFK